MKVLILGMGNPILSDDGVGLSIARKLEKSLPGVDVSTTAMAGIDILDLIMGYDQVFLIDASIAKKGAPGEVTRFDHEENGALHLFSSHGLNFFEVLRLGKVLGYEMPEVGGVYGIEIGDEVCFGHQLTPRLKAKAELITQKIAGDIKTRLAGWKNEAEVNW
ncbi:MAG: hydrogenase maturation protease [Deltaproteobacteria bacterium]|nr:hydrogenase maturation protease [Deltaproteobacteria bacterium]MBW2066822.1 hydrogenase maturation protease [Deltaproteobacteria bacterium]